MAKLLFFFFLVFLILFFLSYFSLVKCLCLYDSSIWHYSIPKVLVSSTASTSFS